MVILPKKGISYPFTQPQDEFPIVLGEWWNSDPIKVEAEAKLSGGAPNVSDAFTINGQPGGSYNCSKSDVLLTANQAEAKYYMATSVYTTQGFYDKTNATAILNYVGSNSSATPIGLNLPEFNDTATLVKPYEAWLQRSIQWTFPKT
ncbi:hypothetical protein SUGI_0962030 [Cryptomeria japonica]|nr:hypothetical protein SUGI_0962030 [Cryptomeria japonica]